MQIGIGVSRAEDGREAALEAVRQAREGAPEPDVALVFGSISFDQEAVHAGLLEGGLDPAILLGGSSYAEVSNAGVTRDSVAVLLLTLDGAQVRIADAESLDDPQATASGLIAALDGWRPGQSLPLALLYTALGAGRENELLAHFRQDLGQIPVFGGMTCGDYDLGMGDPEFWTNYQYAEAVVQKRGRLAVLDLPRDGYTAAFGFEHGWEPVGPPLTVTRSEGPEVFEVEGIPIFDFYRSFLGRDADDQFFETLVQRYGFALELEESTRADARSAVKVAVKRDFERGSMTYYPVDDLQGRRVRLIQSSRRGLVRGARSAAERCLAALGGQRPALVLVVSCCTRNAILHSRPDSELEAVREVFGPDVPIFGHYSGGEIVPLLNAYDEVIDPAQAMGGSGFHATTIGLLALASAEEPTRVRVPALDAATQLAPDGDVLGLLAKSEEILDNTESFLANLSRQAYRDGERLRAQSEVLRRYTPHDVWSQASASAERGDYEIPDSQFEGAFLFMDVKGFTAYSERHAPSEVVEALNALFDPATAIVYECGGDVDKYMGDCVFAAFRDQRGALRAGRRILELFAGLSKEDSPFDVRLGINAGRAIRANVGGVGRREYTFIGDAVNLAQRLESSCSPGKMLISEELYELGRVELGPAERKVIRVKGKQDEVVAYECGS
jgi:class 3 adenylate cyclase